MCPARNYEGGVRVLILRHVLFLLQWPHQEHECDH